MNSESHESNGLFTRPVGLTRKDSARANVRFKDQNLVKNAFPNFEQIRRNGKLCDVTLIDQKFSAHKIVLAATIPYFDAMFLSNMSETLKREIYIHDLDPGILEAFIIFAYTGEIQITPSNVQAVLIGASFLQIDSVRNFSCKYIEERLSLENLISVRSFASSFLCSNLMTACDKLIYENFESLIGTPLFYSLTAPELLKMLESDNLQVTSEENVFHAVIAWCEHQESSSSVTQFPHHYKFKNSISMQSLLGSEPACGFVDTKSIDIMSASTGDSLSLVCNSSLVMANRQEFAVSDNLRFKFLPALLSRVRLPLLPAQFIRDVVSKNERVRSDMRCRDLLDEARDMLLLPDSSQSSPCSFICRPRRGQEVPGVIYAVGGITLNGDCQSIVEAYHPLLDRWEVVESMSTQRSRIAVVVLNGCLYAIGGLDGTSRLNTVERFDPKTGVWQKVASMNYRRSALGAAVLNGRIYVCGGYDGIASLRTCEVYNPEQNRWQVIPSMTECRSAGGVVALEDGRLFAIGGHNGLPIFASVECYHRRGHNQRPASSSLYHHPVQPGVPAPSTAANTIPSGVWRLVAPMLNRRCRHGVAVLRGRIFAAGGYNGSIFLRSVEMFDPTVTEPSASVVGQWTEVIQMNTPRSRVSLAASAGHLYAIGGFDGERNLNTVECFQRVDSRLLCEYESASATPAPNAIITNTSSLSLRQSRLVSNNMGEEDSEEEPRKSVSVVSTITNDASSGDGNTFYSLFHFDGCPIPEISTLHGCDLQAKVLGQPRGAGTVIAGRNSTTFSLSLSSSTTSSTSSTSREFQFADWEWVPAVPLIAHEGGVGVGVIPIY